MENLACLSCEVLGTSWHFCHPAFFSKSTLEIAGTLRAASSADADAASSAAHLPQSSASESASKAEAASNL